MKKVMLYFVAGSMMAATACSSTGSATADSTSMERSETVTSPGRATDETTTTNTNTNTGNTGTTTTTGTNTDRPGTIGATGAATATSGMDATMDMTSLTNLDDATFMMTAASSNLLEIELGEMALEKATDPKVKEYAQMMIDHHTEAKQEMESIASEMGVELPTTMMPMHQTMVDKLASKTGAGFDEDYMDTMERAHKMDIAMFEAKTRNAKNEQVKALAAKTLPKLESHEKMANEIEDTVD